jgi:hypothetical protein
MKMLGQERGRHHSVAPCCELPAPPQAYRYVMVVLIVIVIALWVRYGITIPLPGIVITGGTGYAITLRAPGFRFARPRLV